MAYGARYSYPRRYGGGKSTAQAIYESLNIALGTAFDTSDGSTVTAETSAEARAMAAVWSANARMANNRDPRRMTDMLPRWEAIFSVRPHRTDSDNRRRARLIPKFAALGAELFATTNEICTAFLGAEFVAVEYTALADGLPSWPASSPAAPNNWTSHVGHILIRVVRYDAITTLTFHEYLDVLRELWNFLRDFNSAWSTADWAWDGTGGAGFYFDEDWNYDGEAFDV